MIKIFPSILPLPIFEGFSTQEGEYIKSVNNYGGLNQYFILNNTQKTNTQTISYDFTPYEFEIFIAFYYYELENGKNYFNVITKYNDKKQEIIARLINDIEILKYDTFYSVKLPIEVLNIK